MKRVLYLVVALVLFQNATAQKNEKLFSIEIQKHIRKYNNISDKAYETGNVEKGQVLFDSLVKNFLVGTKLDPYHIKCANGKKLKLDYIEKPLLIITYSSWCVMNKAEIPALNKIAKKYDNNFQLVVLFWDKKRDVKKLASRFNSNIKVCYASECYNSDEDLVSTMKHYLGFPTSYFIDVNLDVIDIQRGNPQVSMKTSFAKTLDYNVNFFNSRISNFLNKKNAVVQSTGN
jgi:thiol-disulfide isomerase/thioredoxin